MGISHLSLFFPPQTIVTEKSRFDITNRYQSRFLVSTTTPPEVLSWMGTCLRSGSFSISFRFCFRILWKYVFT